MYSPATRLLTILELLQSHERLSGAELARRLEVDRRSVRRYVVMLQDRGIPVQGSLARTAATGCALASSCRHLCSPTMRRWRSRWAC